MTRGRSELECQALHPPPLVLGTEIQKLNNNIEEFEDSAITVGFLSSAATQKILVNPFNNFLSRIDSVQSDFIGESTNNYITIDDARGAVREHGTLP